MASQYVDEMPIQYSTEAEFKSRPAYVGPMNLKLADLDRIVGKYELAPDKSFWTACSLNGCTTMHRRGFVLRARSGEETNCGNVCGLHEFGTDFSELEAQYKQLEEKVARQKVIEDLLLRRQDLLSEANRVFDLALRADQGMNSFKEQLFAHGKGFELQLKKCAKIGGAIRVAIQEERADWKINRGPHQQLRTIGSIKGCAAIADGATSLSTYIHGETIPWINAIVSQDHLSSLDDKALQQVLREANKHQDAMRRSAQYSVEVAKFLDKGNAGPFEWVRALLMPKGYERDKLEPTIKAWAASRLE